MIAPHHEPKGLDADEAPFADDSYLERKADARSGSDKLKEAIFKSWGIELRVVTPEPPKQAPKKLSLRPKAFKSRKIPTGRPRGAKKVRTIDPEAFSIATAIAQHFDITVADMVGPLRTYEISHPRQIAMYAIRKRRGLSFGDISFHFGGKDHTTIIHAIREVTKRIEKGDPDTIKALNMIHKVFGA